MGIGGRNMPAIVCRSDTWGRGFVGVGGGDQRVANDLPNTHLVVQNAGAAAEAKGIVVVVFWLGDGVCVDVLHLLLGWRKRWLWKKMEHAARSEPQPPPPPFPFLTLGVTAVVETRFFLGLGGRALL